MEETATIEKTMAEESSTSRRPLHSSIALLVVAVCRGCAARDSGSADSDCCVDAATSTTWFIQWALFGARAWLRLSGVQVKVKGLELLDPKQTYVFVSNHRSYLDTATMFIYTGRRIGLLAKKELLKVPVLGVGMGFVNVMAIDRSNRESAIRTTEAAAQANQVRSVVWSVR